MYKRQYNKDEPESFGKTRHNASSVTSEPDRPDPEPAVAIATQPTEISRSPSQDDGLEVKVTCSRCGSWRRIPPDVLMLADPHCHVCGSVMRPTPEDLPDSPDPAPDPVARSESGDLVDTEKWVDDWWREVNGG